MNSKEVDIEEKTEAKKKMSANTKNFILGTIIWSTLFLLIPIFIYLGVKDWIVALSIAGKVGIGFMLLGFVFLGAVGTQRVSGTGAGMAIVDYKGSSGEDKVSHKNINGVNIMEIVSLGQIWLLIWGAIYLIPYAFGVPFII